MTAPAPDGPLSAQRLTVKLLAEEPCTVQPAELVPVFHRWIQERALDELLIDVADYSHVRQGPGVLLVCHAANYSFEPGPASAGLRHMHKRPSAADFTARLDASVRAVLHAARMLEQAPELTGRLRFSGRELLVGVNDRLLAPATAETLEALRPALEALASRLWPAAPASLAPCTQPRGPFTVHLTGARPATLAELITRLG